MVLNGVAAAGVMRGSRPAEGRLPFPAKNSATANSCTVRRRRGCVDRTAVVVVAGVDDAVLVVEATLGVRTRKRPTVSNLAASRNRPETEVIDDAVVVGTAEAALDEGTAAASASGNTLPVNNRPAEALLCFPETSCATANTLTDRRRQG